jgi:hypothetical protein
MRVTILPNHEAKLKRSSSQLSLDYQPASDVYDIQSPFQNPWKGAICVRRRVVKANGGTEVLTIFESSPRSSV